MLPSSSSLHSGGSFRSSLFLILIIFLIAFSFGRLYRTTEEALYVGPNVPLMYSANIKGNTAISCSSPDPAPSVPALPLVYSPSPPLTQGFDIPPVLPRSQHFHRALLNPQAARVFPELTFWSTDFHITPISDLKFLFKSFQIKIIDKSLSGACESRGTCARDLKVINKDNAYNIGDHPQELSRRLFEAYQNDPEFRSVDAIICFHPIVTCQLYMPFNKTIIMISSTRYEHGQFASHQWQRFNRIIQKLASNPRHLIGGNSVYDADYIQFFTGVPAVYVPSFCGVITARYNPVKSEFLLAHSHASVHKDTYWDGGWLIWRFAVDRMNEAKAKKGGKAAEFQFKGINELYGRYEYQDLANHPAMIHFPYQVSVMSFFEQYRMNLPLFVPSLKFMIQLHLDHALISERTWARIHNRGGITKSDIDGHPDAWTKHDPNNEKSAEALEYWLAKADYYTKPYIQYFDSWDDLIEKLLTTDFQKVSALMEQHNAHFHSELLSQWQFLLERMFKDRPEGGYAMPNSYDQAMRELYGWTPDYEDI
jgi:hypothetical protein